MSSLTISILSAFYAQRLIILKEGRIFKDGPIREVVSNIEALEEANIITRYFYLKNKQNQVENNRLPLSVEEAILIVNG